MLVARLRGPVAAGIVQSRPGRVRSMARACPGDGIGEAQLEQAAIARAADREMQNRPV